MTAWLALSLSALAGEEAPDFDHHREQAALFARRGWWEDAEQEIALALANPAVAADPEALALGAQIAWENLDVPLSIARLRAAAARTPDPGLAEQLQGAAERLSQSYGLLTVSTPQAGVVSRLQIEPVVPPFDPEDQRFAHRAALRWRDRTPLPVTLSLPAGRWLVNGVAVEVVPGGSTRLELPLRLVGAGALAALQVTRLELSLGVGQWSGDRLDLYPGARAMLSLTQPAGPLLLGLGGELDLQPWDAADHTRLTPPGWSLGGRLGGELFLGGPLAVRPSLTLAFAQVPGVALACDEGADGWVCDAAGPALGPAHRVFVAGRALVPGAELLVEHREAGRTTALGSGVKLSVERAFGRLPAAGLAEDEGGAPQAWSLDERAWAATRLSMLANVAFAF